MAFNKVHQTSYDEYQALDTQWLWKLSPLTYLEVVVRWYLRSLEK